MFKWDAPLRLSGRGFRGVRRSKDLNDEDCAGDDAREEKRLKHRPPGRPRVHSEGARGFSVKLEPGHFDTLARVARANGLPDKGAACRHTIEAAGDALWQGDDD